MIDSLITFNSTKVMCKSNNVKCNIAKLIIYSLYITDSVHLTYDSIEYSSRIII